MAYTTETSRPPPAADDDAFYHSPDRGDGAKTVDEQEQNPETTLIPKRLLGGQVLREGDHITLRVVKDYGDEIEVASTIEPEKEREPGAGGSTRPPIPSDDELAGMGTGE